MKTKWLSLANAIGIGGEKSLAAGLFAFRSLPLHSSSASSSGLKGLAPATHCGCASFRNIRVNHAIVA